MVQTITI